MTRRPDPAALVAGLVVGALGVVLLLDSRGALDLGLASLAPIACAAVGAVLVASGLSRRG
ncbi:MAG: hypothetical protein QOE08_2361 [Thermoleophilaceae bacterium]|nr:hypothetical protein [Thermoleophilaceae bacterium]